MGELVHGDLPGLSLFSAPTEPFCPQLVFRVVFLAELSTDALCRAGLDVPRSG